MRTVHGLVAALLTSTLIAALGLTVAVPPTVAEAAVPCSAYDRPVHLAVNPTTQVGFASYSGIDVAIAARSGYTSDQGVLGSGASAWRPGIWNMYRLTNAKTHDVMWVGRGAELDGLLKKGYVKGPRDFYASLASSSCVTPVYRLVKGGVHRYTTGASRRDALKAKGWKYEKIAFYLGTPKTDTQFSFAVVPDTQNETNAGDTRLGDRVSWMLREKSTLDLRFTVATGDLANWDTPTHDQFARVSQAFRPLATAMPFASAPGNHDTAAVCPGGSGCPGARTWETVRNTSTYNAYLGPQRLPLPALRGQFERGKIDNSYQIVSAGGASWLLLSLELWPRTSVISWANSVVKANPTSNVVVVTHSYLDGKGNISTSNGGYGANSPKYLWDHLIKLYPNIKFVLSGHVGQAVTRTDKGVKGNTVVSYLTAVHSRTTNPTRYVEVDTATGIVTSRVYASYGKGTLSTVNSSTTRGISFVRP